MATGSGHDLSNLAAEVGGRLRQALIAEYGPDSGAAATVAALSWGESHVERLRSTEDPLVDLHRVGRRRARWYVRRPLQLPEVPGAARPWIDPAVPRVLGGLRRRDRAALLLHHGYGWSQTDVAAILGADESTVVQAIDSGLAKLRSSIDPAAEARVRDVGDQIVAYAELLDSVAPDLSGLVPVVGHPPSSVVLWRVGLVLAVALLGALVVVRFGVERDGSSPTTLAALTDGTATSAAPVLPPVEVELVNRTAISPATFSNWSHQSAAPGAVVVVDGTYHMLSAAYGDNVATVAHAVSDDGVVWVQASGRPVLDLSEAPWAPREFDRATPRSLVVDAEGTWQLFFEFVWFDRGANQVRSSIGRVVARDPADAWVFDSRPVITRDDAYPWMAMRVSSPSVVVAGAGLVMVFVGEGNAGEVVGLAQSQNGADWELRPGPVFSSADAWEGGGVAQVDLLTVPGGFAMFYAGSTGGERGLAVSANGLEWAPHPNNPLLTASDALTTTLFDSEFVTDGATVLAYLETGESRSEHEVAVLRLNLDIAGVLGALLGEGR